ncbi:MAG: hypothetical protein AB7I09_09020, partial [Planctomycetota bacterium]
GAVGLRMRRGGEWADGEEKRETGLRAHAFRTLASKAGGAEGGLALAVRRWLGAVGWQRACGCGANGAPGH